MDNDETLMRILFTVVIIVVCAGVLFVQWIATDNPASTFFSAILDEFSPEQAELEDFEPIVWLPPVTAMIDVVTDKILEHVQAPVDKNGIINSPALIFFSFMIDENRLLLPLMSMLSFGALLLMYRSMVRLFFSAEHGASIGIAMLELLLRAVMDTLLYMVAVRLFIYVMQFPYVGGVSLITLLMLWLSRLANCPLLDIALLYGLSSLLLAMLVVFLWMQRHLLYFCVFRGMAVLMGVTFTPSRHVIYLILTFILTQFFTTADHAILECVFETDEHGPSEKPMIVVFIAIVGGVAYGLCKCLGV